MTNQIASAPGTAKTTAYRGPPDSTEARLPNVTRISVARQPLFKATWPCGGSGGGVSACRRSFARMGHHQAAQRSCSAAAGNGATARFYRQTTVAGGQLKHVVRHACLSARL